MQCRYVPEKFENESFTAALWGKPEQTLDCFNLEQRVRLFALARLALGTP
jgi:hypothetical protein